jgi:hypothetical protein
MEKDLRISLRFCLSMAVGIGVLLSPSAVGQEHIATRVNGSDPVIDGRLDDGSWRATVPLTDFLQRNPIEGAAPSESTEVRFVYSANDLFVAFRGYDREPSQVYGSLHRRDQRRAADYFTLFIDTYLDKRTAFEFSINPSGARRDVLIYGDGAGRDDSWDPVFDWATTIDSLGWTVEMRIPFSQLRFPPSDSLAFGLRVRRSINRRNEELNWPFVPRDQAGEVSNYGQLVGITGVPAPRRLEVLPYVAGSSAFEPSEDGNPFATGRQSQVRTGGDLKFGVTSGLTLDLTVNPDFGQVEADPAVVNLTAFETFFPERRPFFVEGTNLFQFGLQPQERSEFGGGRRGQEGLVYTRRIGRAPQISADDQGGYAEDLRQTTILGAAKLSGLIGGGWSVGLAQAVTGKEQAAIVDAAGVAGRSPVEPLTSYTVLRAQHVLPSGRLAYGLIGTGTVRRLDESAFDELHQRAFSGGFDLVARFGRDQYEFATAVTGSRVEGSEASITDTQRRSSRYFQRSDQTHSILDSSRTSLSGVAGYARLAKVVGFVTFDLRYGTRSPGFETNDFGFLRRADIHQQSAELELRWLEPGPVFRQFEWRVQEQAEWTWGGERGRTSVETRASADFLNYWNVNVSVERGLSSLSTGLLRGGAGFTVPGQWEFRAGGRTDFRRPISFNAGADVTLEDESGARRWGANASVRWRPPGSLSFSLDGRARWGTTDRQYVTSETVGDSTYYVLGFIDRREISLTLRADVVLSPRMSFEFYAQPFVSAGRYPSLSLAADPKAAAYADRLDRLETDRLTRPGGEGPVEVDLDQDGSVDFNFDEPDFRVVSLRTNAVLRWEFRPGSTLFLVWQQNRRGRRDTGDLDAASALWDAFEEPGTNVFAVKIAYWFGL